MTLKIGKLELDNNLIAAPMAGFSDRAWRILARSFGAGLTFSEMVSVEGVKRSQSKTLRYLEDDERARPFAIQLFGSEPESFAEAMEIVKKYPFDLIDINMGCPVKKVIKRGAGSALMKNPGRIEKILKSVRGVYEGPLTIKIRSGWDEKSINALDISKIAEGRGVDAIIVHPRTQSQGFRGKADWTLIKKVKEAVSIPVIGNGDVVDSESIEKMFEETGCDGIMIGRAALGRPWVFGATKKTLSLLDCHPRESGDPVQHNIHSLDFRFRGNDIKLAQSDIRMITSVIKHHISLLQEYANERYIIFQMRKFVPKYLKGIRGSKTVIHEVCSADSVDMILNSLELFEDLSDKRD